ncbi:MAG: XRE family transcriptional regulator [Alphaproteobacteria bacterium]|nr:XRE family transcriptional regulator [Alphaproteobacteria bacterium]
MNTPDRDEKRFVADRSKMRQEVLKLAHTVRALRKADGLNLEELARRSGLSTSTLSKIENRQISPTFDTLVALASGLGVDVGTLVSPMHAVGSTGRRSISRQGNGTTHETPVYSYTFLCTELTKKKFIPLLATIKAHSVEAFPALSAHEGEEFFYVLSGKVTLHTELYEPTDLTAGDCIYFDSSLGHALIAADEEETRVLWISSSLERIKASGYGIGSTE